jgi:hypothetical protein
MRLSPLLLIASAWCSITAAEYAVAPPPLGDDGNSGSATSPFATLNKALSRAGSGDTVHVLRGGVYRESSLDFRDGVTVRASGPAERGAPWITTSIAIPANKLSPWDKDAKTLTTNVAKPVQAVWVDGQFCRRARFPNQGWLRSADGTTPDRLVSDPAAMKSGHPQQWKGAQVRWRRWSWWWETRPITGVDSNGTLSLGPDNKFQDPFTGLGSAFCIDNCLAELDAPGEWFYDSSTATLYVQPPNGSKVQPLVEVLVQDGGYKVGAATLDGLGFCRIAGSALSVNGKATIRGCEFEQLEDNGIAGSWNAGGTTISDCRFRDVRNNGITWNENPAGTHGTVISGNDLRRIGMEFGYGGSGAWHAVGILIGNAERATVRRNTVIDSGYAGVLLGAPGQLVEQNILVRCMGSLNDGAAIYANSSKNEIRENIILDTVGNLETSQYWYPLGHGIWPEFLSDFREQKIIANTVFGSGGNGLFLTNNYQCEVRDNVFVGNRIGGLHMSGHGKKAAQNHTISGNILVTQEPTRRTPQAEQIPSNWLGNDFQRAIDFEPGINYGKMSGTTFVVLPGTPVAAVKGGSRIDEAAALAQAQSWADSQAKQLKASSLLLINDTAETFTFAAPRGGWSTLDGTSIKDGIEVAPFRSQVLVIAKAMGDLPPYIVASGIDYRAADPGAAPAEPAVAKASSKSRPAPRATPAAAMTTTVDPEVMSRYVAALRERTITASASPRQPRFRYSVMRADITVLSVNGDQATIDLAGSGEMTANLFGRLAPSDGFALAQVLVNGTDDPEGNALAAFFARCAKDQVAYRKHLALAGNRAEEVTAAFPEP